MNQIRQLTLLQRKPGITREQFQEYWLETHAPLVRKLPHVLSYTQHHVSDTHSQSGYPAPEIDVDGIVEFVFDSKTGAGQAFSGPLGSAVLEDAQSFISAMLVLSVTSHSIIEPESEN